MNDHKNKTGRLTALFTITYMVSYITRINYAAVLSEIEASTGWPRALLSAVVTGSFITYGVGQIISGYIADRFSPKKLVLGGLVVTALMNLLMPLCPSPQFMLAAWCLNGFAQAFMWPPITRLSVAAFSTEEYKKAAVRVTFGSAYGTVLIYFIAPLLILWIGWKSVFWFSALCGAVMALFWQKYCIDVDKLTKQEEPTLQPPIKGTKSVLLMPPVLAVMVAISLQGMLRDGVTTWMPTYIADTYHLGTAASILSGAVLPLFTIVCTQMASLLYRKKLTSPVSCSAALFAVGAVAAAVLALFSGENTVLSVVSSALLTGTMQGVCSMLTAMTLPAFERYGDVSTVSGVFNACTYIGSSLSTYGIALFSKRLGWSFTIMLWLVVAVLGMALCLITARPWRHLFPGGKEAANTQK